MLNKLEKFKRANFFTGLVATPKFWNDIQDYHASKERFYNLIYSGYGIVPGVMEELKVSPLDRKGGGLSLMISPGFAIDMFGRALFLYEPVVKIIDYKKYKLPTTIYISVCYDEVLDEFYQNRENSEYQGYQKKVETAKIEIQTKEPDENHLELARILLKESKQGEIKSLQEPADIANPQPNDIDVRFVLWARKNKQGLSPYFKQYFIDILDETRNVGISTFEAIKLSGLREMQTLALTARMLVQCGDVSFEDSINILYPLFDINNHIIQEMLDYERTEEKRVFSTKDSFNEYRSKIFEMGDLIKYYDKRFETLDKILGCHRDIILALKNIFVTRKLTLDDIALLSDDLPRVLIVGTERYTLVDFLDFNDFETEKNHELNKEETKDYSTAKQAFLYPDNVEVRDTVNRYVGGKVSFSIRNIIKKRQMVLIRRTDIFHGDYQVDIALNDKAVKKLPIDTSDSKHRWRNLPVIFEEDLITDNVMQCSFIMPEKGRDNFGKIWIFQKL